MRRHVAPPVGDDDRLTRGDLVRCIRCDAWVPADAVAEDPGPAGWPRRGEELHQAIVLRLVAIDRASHAVILIPVGLLLGWLWLRLNVLSPEARDLAQGLARLSDDVGHLGGQLGSVATKVATLKRDHVRNLALLALAYGTLEGVEAVGLWLEQRWAEYLTVVATASLLPLEILELTRHVTALRVVGFVINVAVVIYLVKAKRLFGLGGEEPARTVDLETIAGTPNPQKARPAAGEPPPGSGDPGGSGEPRASKT